MKSTPSLIVVFCLIISIPFVSSGCADDASSDPFPFIDCESGFKGRMHTMTTHQDLQSFFDAGCTEVTGHDIRIYDISGVTDLSLLEHLTHSKGVFEVGYTSDLRSLKGLEHLDFALGLSLVHNPHLSDIAALSSLSGVKTDVPYGAISAINIADNDSLADLDGLGGVQWLGAALYIEENDYLQSLGGLPLKGFFGENSRFEHTVIIRNNPRLPTCEAQAFVDRLEGVERAIIEGNDDSANCD